MSYQRKQHRPCLLFTHPLHGSLTPLRSTLGPEGGNRDRHGPTTEEDSQNQSSGGSAVCLWGCQLSGEGAMWHGRMRGTARDFVQGAQGTQTALRFSDSQSVPLGRPPARTSPLPHSPGPGPSPGASTGSDRTRSVTVLTSTGQYRTNGQINGGRVWGERAASREEKIPSNSRNSD